MRGSFAGSAAVLLISTGMLQAAPVGRVAPKDIETLFFISKSDDRNRVDYGMRLDSHCAPYGEEPVFPYWREFEPPPPVRTKPMGFFAKMGYGISTQRVLQRTAAGGETTIELKQVERVIFITTSQGANGRCSALVRTTIANVQYAELVSIFVQLSCFLSVSYIDIKGKNLATGKPIEERLQDLTDKVEAGSYDATEDEKAEARSLIEAVREEHQRIRVRFGAVTRYEERLRRLESALAEEMAAAAELAHQAALNGALANAPTHGAVDLPEDPAETQPTKPT
jgi:hypothetical protein